MPVLPSALLFNLELPILNLTRIQQWAEGHRTILTGGLVAFTVCVVAVTALRTFKDYSVPSNEFDWENRGLSDFHNGTYYPTLAFRNGDNPYAASVVDKYLMSRSAPLFSPFVFILHLPFSFLDLPQADVAFFAYNTLLILLLAFAAIRASGASFGWLLFLTISALILVSRPGHITLFTGYFTAELVLGMALSLHFARSRPALSGLGLLLASGKPNFIIPLMLLMLFRRDWKAVGYGIAFCGAAAVAGVLWLASFSSVGEVVDGFREGQAALHADESELPINTWTRVDLVGMTAKLLRANPGDAVYLSVMLGLLVVPGMALWRLSKQGYAYGASGLTGMIIAVSMLLSIYHHSYDCLVLAVPWVGFAFFGNRVLADFSPVARWTVVVLAGVPAVNYLSTMIVRNLLNLDQSSWLWQGITMINGVCLFAALVVLLIAAFRISRANSAATSGTAG